MPKMKTRKCVAKRVKKTGTGKYMHFKSGRRHLMTGKGGKRKRHLKRAAAVKSTEMSRIKKALPYG